MWTRVLRRCRPGVASAKSQVPTLPSEPVLSVKEVAALLGVCRTTAYRLCERGEIPHLRIYNAIRVPQAALETFPASQDQKARPRRSTPAPASRRPMMSRTRARTLGRRPLSRDPPLDARAHARAQATRWPF